VAPALRSLETGVVVQSKGRQEEEMKKILVFVAAALLLMGGIVTAPANADNIPVKLELSLLVDVSGSVSESEWQLQRDGYVAAFSDPYFYSGVIGSGAIAVNYIYWSGASQQQNTVSWTLIDSQASANAFAAAIFAATRPFSGLTAPGSAINFAAPQFASNIYDGLRQVIDVSGDGQQNDGADTSNARDAALLAGIDAINGLVILGETGLLNWYINNVQGGANSFTYSATFENFATAIDQKIEREIIGTPEPLTLLLLGAGLFGLGILRRRD